MCIICEIEVCPNGPFKQIFQKLNELKELIMADQVALDAEVAAVGAAVDDNATANAAGIVAIKAMLDKIATMSAPVQADFSVEVAALTAAHDKLVASTAALAAATPAA